MLVPASDVVGIDEVIVGDKDTVDSNGIFVDEIVGLLVGNIDPVVDWKGVVSPAVEAAGVLASVLSDFVELLNEKPSAVFSIGVVSVGSLPP